jgi:soluble lytic murein transglycosylase
LAASGAPAALRAQALLWQGKLASRAGDQATARARWQAAVDVGPSWYGGLRARGLLDSGADLLASPRPLDLTRVEPTRDDLDEFDAWLAARGASLDALVGEQTAEPALARADELLALGLATEAAWELDDLAVKYAGDAARLAALSLALHGRSLDNAAIKMAQQALDAARVSPPEAPVVLKKLLYPLPYHEFFGQQAPKRGVDPLLFASLVRQESHFEPKARSAADARGLTQVMPATGRAIAGALNRSDFRVEDLFRPSVSLEFGAFYFGDRLKRFGGAVFPALAAYNAGDGAVLKWIGDYGLDDVDAFAEQIPYAETNHYLKVIFENYGIYQSLYGAR